MNAPKKPRFWEGDPAPETDPTEGLHNCTTAQLLIVLI